MWPFQGSHHFKQGLNLQIDRFDRQNNAGHVRARHPPAMTLCLFDDVASGQGRDLIAAPTADNMRAHSSSLGVSPRGQPVRARPENPMEEIDEHFHFGRAQLPLLK